MHRESLLLSIQQISSWHSPYGRIYTSIPSDINHIKDRLNLRWRKCSMSILPSSFSFTVNFSLADFERATSRVEISIRLSQESIVPSLLFLFHSYLHSQSVRTILEPRPRNQQGRYRMQKGLRRIDERAPLRFLKSTVIHLSTVTLVTNRVLWQQHMHVVLPHLRNNRERAPSYRILSPEYYQYRDQIRIFFQGTTVQSQQKN